MNCPAVIGRCRDYRGSDCMMLRILGPSERSVIGRCRIIEEAIEQSLVSLGASELSAIGRCRDYRGSDCMKFSIFRSK